MKLLITLVSLFVLLLSGCIGVSEVVENPDNQHGMMMDGHMMMVASDAEFIELMIPHHQEAVDTSELVLKTTKNPELKAFLEDVIETQSQEINQMQDWYMTWFGKEVPQSDYMAMMSGLEKFTGAELDKAYIEGMILHHEGAVDMARQALKFTERQEITEMAQAIIDVQTKEIETLKGWLNES